MPLLEELHEWTTAEMAKGNGKLHVNPVVIVEHLVAERIKNTKEKTRFAWETDTSDGYKDLHKGKDRLMRIIGNKQVAISVAAMLWNETSEDAIKRLAEPEEAGGETA